MLSSFTSAILALSGASLFVLLLQDTHYYNIPKENQGKVLGSMVTISEILNIFLYQVIGICYDLVGRKIIIVATTLFASIAVGMMPFCGTVWPWLVASKLTLSFSMVALSTKPLLADYSD